MVGLTGLVPEEQRSGAAAAGLRALARRHGWAVVAACTLRSEHFLNGESLAALLGDERVAYESDRIFLLRSSEPSQPCGCFELVVHTLKDRAGPARSFEFVFWGERLFPAIEIEDMDWKKLAQTESPSQAETS